MSSKDNQFQLASTCKNSMLAAYQVKISQQNKNLMLIRRALPEVLAQHLVCCVVSAKKCIVYADTEEWLTQLQLYLPIVLQTLQIAGFATVELVQARLAPPPVVRPVARHIKPPSKETADLIRDNLQTIADDELKQALLRLSRTLDRLS